jgi:ketosteroid isomerase-like protein
MTTGEVASRLCQLCTEHRYMEAIDELYDDEIVSAEAFGRPGLDRETRGKEAVRQKNEAWGSINHIRRSSLSEPFLHGDDQFAVMFQFAGTNTATGDPFDMTEVAVYTVADGKIIREEFYYTP